MNINIIDYNEKYIKEINEIETNQWGTWSTSDISKEITPHTFIKLAQYNNEIVGFSYGKQIGDAFHYQAVVIKPKFQKHHLGTKFMDLTINHCKKNNIKNIICEAIMVNEKMNAKKLLDKYNFKEIIRIKNYWGYKDPEVFCTECNQLPCICTNVVHIKEL